MTRNLELPEPIARMRTPTKPPTPLPPERKVALAMQVIVTLTVLGFSLYVIASKGYGDDAEKWAYGMIGALLMYWLKDSIPWSK